MKKILSSALVISLLLLSLCACGTPAEEQQSTAPDTTEAVVKTPVNIAVLKGPTGMGAVKIIEDDANDATLNDYEFTIASAPDQITAKLVNGELDAAFIPTNAVSALYNKTNGGVKIAAVSTLGVLYILENGDSINSFSDLEGKTILASGKGSTAEYVLNFLLEKNGLKDGENVTVEYAAEHTEAASQAIAGKYDIVMLPEPFVTSLRLQNDSFRVKLNLSEEWEKATQNALTMGALAIRTEFAEEHPDAVKYLTDEYNASAAFVNANPEEAATLIEKYDIAKAAVAQKAIPNCAIVCLTNSQMKDAVAEFLSVVSENDASAIGGKMPDEAFYITE